MSDVSKRFEQLVKSTYKKFLDHGTILPVKTDKGILVGDVLIESDGPLKNIYKKDKLIYSDISLNAVAIKIANLLAWNSHKQECEKLYNLDTVYSKHFNDSKFHIAGYHKATANKDDLRADVLWTRYQFAKEKAISAREEAEELASFE